MAHVVGGNYRGAANCEREVDAASISVASLILVVPLALRWRKSPRREEAEGDCAVVVEPRARKVVCSCLVGCDLQGLRHTLGVSDGVRSAWKSRPRAADAITVLLVVELKLGSERLRNRRCGL